MKDIVKNSLVWIFIIGMYSCSKDYLRPEPLSFFSAENTYINEEGFNSLLVTLRKNLASEQSGGVYTHLYHQWAVSEAGVPIVQLDMNQLTPNSDRYSNFVGQINDFYRYIKDANTVISRIDNIEWDIQEKRNAILAEALWHRSYWYYRLVH